MQQKFKVAFLGIAVLSIGIVVVVISNSIANNNNLGGKDTLADEVANEISSVELEGGVVLNFNKFGWEVDSDYSAEFSRLRNLNDDSLLTINIEQLSTNLSLQQLASDEVTIMQKISETFTLKEVISVKAGDNDFYRIMYTDKNFGVTEESKTIKYIGIKDNKKIIITYVYLENDEDAIGNAEDIASKLVF